MQDREKQFKELFLSEYGRMYKAACILLGDEDEAKDVVQDVFAKLWAGTITLREETQRAFLLSARRLKEESTPPGIQNCPGGRQSHRHGNG